MTDLDKPKAPRVRKSRPTLQGARKESVEARLATVPTASKNKYARACAGTASPKTAIAAFCHQCTGYDRVAVRNCTALACPLWAYRPFQKG